MPPSILPLVPSEPNYTFTCTIRGQEVFIEARWNERDKVVDADGNVLVDGAWYLDWFDANGDPIVRSMKVVLGVNLGRQLTHDVFRRIIVRAVDTSAPGAGRDAGFTDIGVDGARVVVKVYTVTDDGFIE